MSEAVDSLDRAKKDARQAAALRRAAAHAADAEAPRLFADNFLSHIPMASDAVVAGYWPIGTEMDVRPLLERLVAVGLTCALPVVPGARRSLLFRSWEPGDELEAGPFDVPAPRPGAKAVTPTVVIVPLLAFDRRGHRLGYGAGFYDRTLSGLRAHGSVLAVGAAYAAQETEQLPTDAFDAPLDWIVTEREARRFSG